MRWKWILYALTLPYTLSVGYPWVLLMMLIGAARGPEFEQRLVLAAEWRPWAARIWRYSTTLGRGVIYQPVPDPRIKQHEHVHVRQVEDQMLQSFILGLVVWGLSGSYLAGLGVWWSGGIWQLTNFLSAWLRGMHFYRGSSHEREARALTEPMRKTDAGRSWLEVWGE